MLGSIPLSFYSPDDQGVPESSSSTGQCRDQLPPIEPRVDLYDPPYDSPRSPTGEGLSVVMPGFFRGFQYYAGHNRGSVEAAIVGDYRALFESHHTNDANDTEVVHQQVAALQRLLELTRFQVQESPGLFQPTRALQEAHAGYVRAAARAQLIHLCQTSLYAAELLYQVSSNVFLSVDIFERASSFFLIFLIDQADHEHPEVRAETRRILRSVPTQALAALAEVNPQGLRVFLELATRYDNREARESLHDLRLSEDVYGRLFNDPDYKKRLEVLALLSRAASLGVENAHYLLPPVDAMILPLLTYAENTKNPLGLEVAMNLAFSAQGRLREQMRAWVRTKNFTLFSEAELIQNITPQQVAVFFRLAALENLNSVAKLHRVGPVLFVSYWLDDREDAEGVARALGLMVLAGHTPALNVLIERLPENPEMGVVLGFLARHGYRAEVDGRTLEQILRNVEWRIQREEVRAGSHIESLRYLETYFQSRRTSDQLRQFQDGYAPAEGDGAGEDFLAPAAIVEARVLFPELLWDLERQVDFGSLPPAGAREARRYLVESVFGTLSSHGLEHFLATYQYQIAESRREVHGTRFGLSLEHVLENCVVRTSTTDTGVRPQTPTGLESSSRPGGWRRESDARSLSERVLEAVQRGLEGAERSRGGSGGGFRR